MDLEFRAQLDHRLGDSRIEIHKIVSTILPEGDPQHAINQRKLEAHQEREKCIEKLLRIEDRLDELGSGP
jgi:ribosome maturation protein Sdo1